MTTTFVSQPMAWNHERMKYTSNECLSFKALWKMLMLDDTIDSKATTKRKNVSASVIGHDGAYLQKRFICGVSAAVRCPLNWLRWVLLTYLGKYPMSTSEFIRMCRPCAALRLHSINCF